MEDNRPNLRIGLDADLFLQFYYLKEEMQDFCREQGLSVSGGKNEIKSRVEAFLRNGTKEPQGQDRKVFEQKRINPVELSLDAVIEDNFRSTELHREFFASIIGRKFHFNVKFQKYLKENTGKTYAEAVEAWYRLDRERKESRGMEPIDSQFEYNRYIRAFFAENPGRTLKDAITCWKYKRNQPGTHAYDKRDLAALERE
ncbi:MAG TPA: DUF6434 domain-containing protein [Bacillota bacterium]|nr:DUF6434 domain-containing protein [Bacillota bacterium]